MEKILVYKKDILEIIKDVENIKDDYHFHNDIDYILDCLNELLKGVNNA